MAVAECFGSCRIIRVAAYLVEGISISFCYQNKQVLSTNISHPPAYYRKCLTRVRDNMSHRGGLFGVFLLPSQNLITCLVFNI